MFLKNWSPCPSVHLILFHLGWFWHVRYLSGCGISPTTLPFLLLIPAMLLSEPFGFSGYVAAEYLNIICLFSSSCLSVFSSAVNLPSPCATGASMFCSPFVSLLSLLLVIFIHRHSNLPELLFVSVALSPSPGRSPVFTSVWKPLHIPSIVFSLSLNSCICLLS